MSAIGSMEEFYNRALKLHSIISTNRDNPNIRMGVPFVRYWDELATKLNRGFFHKPFLVSNRSWVRNIVLEDPKAFACLAPHIRLELLVDGKLRYCNGWGNEITHLSPYLLEFLLQGASYLFKDALGNIEHTVAKQPTSIREDNQFAKSKHQLLATVGEIGRDGDFIAYSDGAVLDTRTNLMWAAKDNGADINWQDAKTYCENYPGGGYTDWRMPTQDELAGLYDANKSRPAVCYTSYQIHVATELIDITCFAPWASEIRGSDAATFVFISGLRDWFCQSIDRGCRALPVRSGKGETGLGRYLHNEGGDAMGMFNWLQKSGLAGMIPKNAYEQYNKWRRKDSSLSEGEIAQGIFNLRYIIGKPILNQAGNNRLLGYMASDFECNTLMDFCLVSLDIEGEINPSDGSAFFNTAKIINEELDRLGFKVGKDHINSFVYRWTNRQLKDGFT